MNSIRIAFYLILIISISLFSCKKPLPQLPANKAVKTDVNSTVLLDINKNLAIKEDSILKVLATKMDKSFQKNEIGFWYKIDKKTNAKTLQKNDSCQIAYKIKLIDNTVVFIDTLTVTLGKKQVVLGLEEGLKLLRKGEIATLIVPWYLGYGMNGLEQIIPPYTSLIFEVNIKD